MLGHLKLVYGTIILPITANNDDTLLKQGAFV